MFEGAAFLTVKDIAEYSNSKELTVYRLLKAGQLEHFEFGRQIRVNKEDFETFLRASRIPKLAGRE